LMDSSAFSAYFHPKAQGTCRKYFSVFDGSDMRYAICGMFTLGSKLKTVAQTTAHTLSPTFALLALYPEVQEKMLKHIKSVIPGGRRPISQCGGPSVLG